MIKKQIILILFFVFSFFQMLNAQENELTVLYLKNGYSVKGKIIEQTSQSVKIKTINGEIFEYKTDEISSTGVAKKSSLLTKSVPQTIATGDMLLSAGIGFFRLPFIESYEKLTFPPIPITFEYVVKDDLFKGNGSIGIGGFLGYSSIKSDGYYESSKRSRFIIGARGYLHYAFVKKLDTYSGILLGYKSDVTKYGSDEKRKYGKPTFNIFAGCRYFFTDKIAGMAELGWGISIVTIGVSMKL